MDTWNPNLETVWSGSELRCTEVHGQGEYRQFCLRSEKWLLSGFTSLSGLLCLVQRSLFQTPLWQWTVNVTLASRQTQMWLITTRPTGGSRWRCCSDSGPNWWYRASLMQEVMNLEFGLWNLFWPDNFNTLLYKCTHLKLLFFIYFILGSVLL